MGWLYGDDSKYAFRFDLVLGQPVDVRYAYECPKFNQLGDELSGRPYRFETTTGGSNPPWTVPPGLQINWDGFSGTPSQTGEWYLNVSVTCTYKWYGELYKNASPYQVKARIRVHK